MRFNRKTVQEIPFDDVEGLKDYFIEQVPQDVVLRGAVYCEDEKLFEVGSPFSVVWPAIQAKVSEDARRTGVYPPLTIVYSPRSGRTNHRLRLSLGTKGKMGHSQGERGSQVTYQINLDWTEEIDFVEDAL